ncbi:MAG: HupE/UreJ family protein [Verrucomicrobiota bacterium]
MAVIPHIAKARWKSLVAATLVFLTTRSAHAHMLVDGAGDLGNGALHPLMSPAHLLVLIGLALHLAQQVPFELNAALRTFALASAAALALTFHDSLGEVDQPVLVALALLLGILVGLEIRLPRWATLLIAALVAACVGLDSGVEDQPSVATTKILLGTWLVINALVPYLAMVASNGAEKKWARTAIRVLGSWIIAVSLMVLAFALRK